MIVVLDCNIWVSLSINKQLDFIIHLVKINVEIASCQLLESEILDVINRPKLKKFLPYTAIQNTYLIFDRHTVKYIIGNYPVVVTDLNDNYLFALCKKSKAKYFITGDKLLLQQKAYGKTQIITLSEFKKIV